MPRHKSTNPGVLSFEDKVMVAWAYHCEHIPQHTLAALFRVNSGRVNEACTAVRKALEGERDAE